MKNLLKKSLLFFLFFIGFSILANGIYLFVIASTDWDFKKRIEALSLKNPDFEMLVMGNSLPEYGIDTELLTSKGVKSYNLSIIGNSDQTSYIQLREYIEKYHVKPKIVLYCVAAYEDAFYNQGVHPIVEFTMKGHKYGFKDVPLFKFRWFGVEFLKKLVSKPHRETYITMGQIRSPRIVPDHTSYISSPLHINTITNSQWIARIAKLCYEQDIKLLIIEMPGMKETQNDDKLGPERILFDDRYPALLYNFNAKDFSNIFDPARDWCGLSHLNQYGATKFTDQVYFHLKAADLILK